MSQRGLCGENFNTAIVCEAFSPSAATVKVRRLYCIQRQLQCPHQVHKRSDVPAEALLVLYNNRAYLRIEENVEDGKKPGPF